MIYSWDIMEVIAMDYVGRTVKDPSKIDNTEMQNILNELNRWCMNYRGFINQVFSEQVTMEEKVTKLFWVVKKVAESQLDVTESYNDLYQFVINYFDSHDFQTMVNNKLDQMAEDGTLESLINDRILGGIKNDISSVSARVSTLEGDMSNQKVLVGKLTGWSLSGKQIDWFGDSIIRGEMPGGAIAEKPIPTLFAELTGATCVNHAQSGATISNNEWATKVINQVNDADLTNSDYVIVQGGINDYVLNYPITLLSGGFIAGLIEIFNAISYKNPNAKIIMLTMFPNNALFNGSLGHDGQNFVNYNDEIKSVCRDRGIRCIDMTYNSINRAYFNAVSSDGTHFNQAGYNILAVSLLNAINTAGTQLPMSSGTNLLKGMFPTMDLTGTEETNGNVMRHGNCIVIRPGEQVYTCVSMNLLGMAYTLTFKMRVNGGKANIEFGTEGSYQAIGKLNNIAGTETISFYTYTITINPTTFNGRMVFHMTEDSTCQYAVISQICLVPGEVPCFGDEVLNNQATVTLAGFNSQYPLLFKQRDRFVAFNGPVQVGSSQIPANTELADLSNYNFAKGLYCPASAVIYTSGLDGTVYPLLLDFTTYKLKTLKTIPANTNLGITSVIDIS